MGPIPNLNKMERMALKCLFCDHVGMPVIEKKMSLIHGRQFILPRRWLIMFIVLLASTWVGKYIPGSAYY